MKRPAHRPSRVRRPRPPAWIGITIGDITGIGPEVTLKALAADPLGSRFRYLLIGDFRGLQRLNASLGLPLRPFLGYETQGRFLVLDPGAEPLPATLAPGSAVAARAAVRWLAEGAARCSRGELTALVTAPVNKAAIIRSGLPFVGQTEYLSELAREPRTTMMLLGHDDRGRWLRVALATTHLPLKRVARELSAEKVRLAIDLAADACRRLGLPRARVGVCGLNTHAGESGALGTEELTIIGPAIERVRARHVDVSGPLPADTLFHLALRGDFDALVAMYHDQGLAPLKMIAFETGVNWTLGLPFIRTSPDHGTAYDLAGKDRANPASMIAAIRLAGTLSARSNRR